MPTPPHIQQLHDAFQRETGMLVLLTEWRVRCWHEWLEHCRGEWGEEQIRAVVKHLRAQIATRARTPAALLFRNLVERPDSFEEDLNLARQDWKRGRRPAEREVTKIVAQDAEGNVAAFIDTEQPAATNQPRPAANLVAGVLEQLKKGAKRE